MPGTHAVLSPSSLSRVFKCPGSVYYAQQYAEMSGPEVSHEWAAEGTVAHEVRELCLKSGMEPQDFLGRRFKQEGFVFEVTDEMVNALTPGIDRIRSRPGKVFIEERVTFDRWMPGQFGTLDCGIASKGLIEIDDLKYGAGVPVSPDDNPQLKTYALGFWSNIAGRLTEAEDFLLVIDQPRATGGGGEWPTTLRDLLEFGEELKELFFEVFGEDPQGDDPTKWRVKSRRFSPGDDQCRFCAFKSDCPHLAKHNLEVMQATFDDLEEGELVSLSRLTPEQRALVAINKPLIETWLRDVYDSVLADLMDGAEIDGVKLIRGRQGPRSWADTDMAADVLELLIGPDRAYKRTLLTPTQVLSLPNVKKEDDAWVSRMVTQSDGKIKVAPSDAAGTEVIRGAAMFDEYDD